MILTIAAHETTAIMIVMKLNAAVVQYSVQAIITVKRKVPPLLLGDNNKNSNNCNKRTPKPSIQRMIITTISKLHISL